ncbi:hypothetical protein Ahy_B03g061677 isoform B [Arachis hypogaea]|uniref:glutathione transferase n=1 Tax=Arachis hypogaea TaxID=3818 RepID=A0A444ZRE8_ARAHY|nr:hypothetical protein Ahy_B03g061677 isoform B [Arachis hypogaea]
MVKKGTHRRNKIECKTKKMGSKDVKLVSYWVSPFGKRAEWALKLKGVEYEYIEEDIYNKSNLLLELNPVHKKVPVLVHGNKAIAESFVILEYIDETWKQYPLMPHDPYQRAHARFWAISAEQKYPLMPQNPYQRAHARFWANFAEQKLLVAARIARLSSGEEQGKAVNEAREAMEKIEEEIKGKKFFGGDKIGYLDIVIGWISYWIPVWEEVGSMKILDPLKFPAINAWITNFLSHPTINDTLPQRDKMVVYYHSRRKEVSPS